MDRNRGDAGEAPAETLDLRGVRCPLNWARARVRLEQIDRDTVLELLVDDPRGARDIPRAAEAEGCDVIAVTEEGGVWRIVLAR